MRVTCRTNLDLSEDWPTELPQVPRIGDKVQSKTRHGHLRLSLKVVSVTWIENEPPVVELHTDQSVVDFYKWYAPLVGRSISSFI